jgi:hypothetical protein
MNLGEIWYNKAEDRWLQARLYLRGDSQKYPQSIVINTQRPSLIRISIISAGLLTECVDESHSLGHRTTLRGHWSITQWRKGPGRIRLAIDVDLWNNKIKGYEGCFYTVQMSPCWITGNVDEHAMNSNYKSLFSVWVFKFGWSGIIISESRKSFQLAFLSQKPYNVWIDHNT